jgi:uncharacterized protein
MSQEGIVVDLWAFARDGQRFERVISVSAFPRLAAETVRPDGVLSVGLVGERDRDGKHFLHLSVDGAAELACQRCLSPMFWQCSVRSHLLLVPIGAAIPDEELENDSYDAVEVGAKHDLLALVEDEILLALPVVPRHEVCEAPDPSGGAEMELPFAALAKMRGSKGSE